MKNKAIGIAILILLVAFALWRYFSKSAATTTQSNNPFTPQQPAEDFSKVEKVADAINIITNAINGCKAYGVEVNEWCKEIIAMTDAEIAHLIGYWNEKYFNTNGLVNYGMGGLSVPFGGQRTISEAINTLFCYFNWDCLDCDIKQKALQKLNNK